MTKDLSNVAKVEFKEKCFNFFFLIYAVGITYTKKSENENAATPIL